MSPGASSNPGTWGSNPNKTLNGVDLMALWRLVLYWNWSMEIKGSQSVHSLPCSMRAALRYRVMVLLKTSACALLWGWYGVVVKCFTWASLRMAARREFVNSLP